MRLFKGHFQPMGCQLNGSVLKCKTKHSYLKVHLLAFCRIHTSQQVHIHLFTDGSGCHARCRPAHREQFRGSVSCPRTLRRADQGNWTIVLQITRRWLYTWATAARFCTERHLFNKTNVSFIPHTLLCPCQNPAPTLPTLQPDCRQFSLWFRCVTLEAANLALSC